MSPRRHICLFALIGLLLPVCASAEPPASEQPGSGDQNQASDLELISDRPNFTESSTAIPAGHLQAEAGIEYRGAGGLHSFSSPALLVRYGLVSSFELRVGAPSVEASGIGSGDTQSGVGPVSLGAKYAVGLSDSVRVGLIPQVELDVSAVDDSSAGLIGTVALQGPGSVGLAANLGVTNVSDPAGGRHFEYSGSLSAGIGISDRLGSFVEYYTLIPEDSTRHFADTGVTYLVTKTFQLDAYVGLEIAELDEVIAGAGLVYLY